MTTDAPQAHPPSTLRRLLWFAAIWTCSLIGFAVVVYGIKALIAP